MFYISKIGLTDGYLHTKLQVHFVRLCVRIVWMIILAELCGTAGIQEAFVGGAGSWEVGGDSFIGVAIVLSGLRLCIMLLSAAAIDDVTGGATLYNT